jgi:phytoene synthase
MTLEQTIPLDSRLLSLAHEALDQSPHPAIATLDSNLLAHAYHACTELTRQHSRTFMLASALLPESKRQAVRALYAFCRISDDIVDHNPESDPLGELSSWRRRALSAHPSDNDLMTVAWADTRLKFGIPALYAEQLLDGVAADLTKHRYQTFEELAAYSYRVASTVGLMSMHIIGF